ncbi:ribosome silencing factor [Calidifontimicrobium sp. SYSU G02091]|uniref:ribosome silencing factor n=1 Tax=Calidifontimicrobium sp. SYSU G02091 TaxID=2926421 RepID=UPI001F537CD7|nr:ribosome silencing factor [Calidifontimicrobium sp. SYSU G02091]MCI1191581.1 ribosome silencing factor [Calidifontimicrobium sp. SYSU G02091]
MDIRKLQRAIVDGLEDVKAQNIVVFNTEHLSPLFERVIIASGTSNRQTKALASSVRETVKARGMPVLRTEGEDNGEWIIVDCGAAVCHIMQPAIREYYHLEEIWGGKPVRVKLGGAARGLPKAGEASPQSAPTDEHAEKQAGKRAAKTAAKTGAKTAAKTATKPARQPAGEPPAAKTKAAKTPAAKTPAAKAPAAKRTAAAAGPTRARSAAGKTVPRKTAAAKSAAKTPVKTPVKTVRVGAKAAGTRRR